jgi:hemerythrin
MYSLSKTILDKKTMPLVDIGFMNKTHLEEIVMVKKLGELVTDYLQNKSHSESEIDQITLALQTWLEHTQAHFKRENELMEKIDFPAFKLHSDAHTNALARMSTVMNIWKEKQDIQHLQDYVFNLWPNWFTEHVNSMDIMTARHAKKHGYNEEGQAT